MGCGAGFYAPVRRVWHDDGSVNSYFYPLFQISLVPGQVLSVFGMIFMVVGIPFFILSIVTVMRAYNAVALVTRRHFQMLPPPFIRIMGRLYRARHRLPDKSWLCLTTPVFMYVILHHLVEKEERYLSSPCLVPPTMNIRKTYPRILPLGWMK